MQAHDALAAIYNINQKRVNAYPPDPQVPKSLTEFKVSAYQSFEALRWPY